MTIAVVFAGMFFSLSKITEIETGLQITGMLSTATIGNATLTATVESSLSISVPVSSIALGSLEPGQWNSSENSSLTHDGVNHATRWNHTNVTSNITIQNDGSALIDIEIYDTDQSAAGMGPFSGTSGCASDNTCFYVRCGHVQDRNETGGDCTDPTQPTSYTVLPDSAGTAYISHLNFTDSVDEAFIFVNVTIPEDEHAASLTETITFAAVASS